MSISGDPHLFVSGNLALNFIGTAQERRSTYIERLATEADLGEWAVAAGVLDTAPDCTGALDRAKALREAAWRIMQAELHGEGPAAADAALVNRHAADRVPDLTLRPDGTVTRTGTIDSALAAIARSALELLGGPDRERIKECGRSECSRLYLDTSRGGSRRWCDMAVCGNRAKIKAYRARNTQATV
ncbi:CGNR zinc finger domain-containing protein [Nocardia sp. CDC160]|uniref:CGNR zinc finger domain-containing protein n=1 Tax=Nocardia sp. CDC160 TaxID=3112166 RepID=UPI002DB737DB|nr:ABATE domain-containing protein [Nocardia sp. CDC160]MEC3914278.1 ABATE domain-containing protein [Nocardia sp. CDC160]